MSPEKLARAHEMLKDGVSAYRVSKDLDLGYMAVYKLGTGETHKAATGGARTIAKREAKVTPERRDWAWKMQKKGWKNSKIAKSLEVSETTVYRILADAKLLLAHRVQRMFLSSGSHEAAMRAYKLRGADVEELIEMASTPLPKRLAKELD